VYNIPKCLYPAAVLLSGPFQGFIYNFEVTLFSEQAVCGEYISVNLAKELI